MADFSRAWIFARALAGMYVRLPEAKGWSQEEYADRAGIHRTYVGDIERGRRNPTVTIVEKLAKPLGVNCSTSRQVGHVRWP